MPWGCAGTGIGQRFHAIGQFDLFAWCANRCTALMPPAHREHVRRSLEKRQVVLSIRPRTDAIGPEDSVGSTGIVDGDAHAALDAELSQQRHLDVSVSPD